MSDLGPQRPLCPTCGSSMAGAGGRPAKAYRCSGCQSAWVPRLALARVRIPLPEGAAPGMRHSDRRPCPGCDRLMALRGDDALQIDVCLWCGGVFLDPGELEQLGALERRRADGDGSAVHPEKEVAGAAGTSWPWWVEVLVALLPGL